MHTPWSADPAPATSDTPLSVAVLLGSVGTLLGAAAVVAALSVALQAGSGFNCGVESCFGSGVEGACVSAAASAAGCKLGAGAGCDCAASSAAIAATPLSPRHSCGWSHKMNSSLNLWTMPLAVMYPTKCSRMAAARCHSDNNNTPPPPLLTYNTLLVWSLLFTDWPEVWAVSVFRTSCVAELLSDGSESR